MTESHLLPRLLLLLTLCGLAAGESPASHLLPTWAQVWKEHHSLLHHSLSSGARC